MGKSSKNEKKFEVSRHLNERQGKSTLMPLAASRCTLASVMPLAVLVILFVFTSLFPVFLTLGHAAPNDTTRVSVSTSGEEGNGSSDPLLSVSRSSISADGRYVFFRSRATNLVVGDSNGLDDLFLHDQQTGNTSRVTDSSFVQRLLFRDSQTISARRALYGV